MANIVDELGKQLDELKKTKSKKRRQLKKYWASLPNGPTINEQLSAVIEYASAVRLIDNPNETVKKVCWLIAEAENDLKYSQRELKNKLDIVAFHQQHLIRLQDKLRAEFLTNKDPDNKTLKRQDG